MMEHKLPTRFIKKIQGRDFVLFEGLLDMAHAAGLKRVETQLLQPPTKDNGMLAIARAVIETEKGVFSALGDASPDSAEAPMRPHLVRLADTRAIARALRLAVNVGMTAYEEINASEPVIGANGESGNGKGRKSAKASKTAKAAEPATVESPGELRLSFGKYADRTLGDILVEDRSYIEWLAKEAYDTDLREAAKQLLASSEPVFSDLDPTGTDEIPF